MSIHNEAAMIFSNRAWLHDRWQKDVRLKVVDGVITAVTPGADPAPDDDRVDTLLPALANLHSHSFQRAMAGMTEYRGDDQDSFWTWRSLMYRFLDHLTPDHIQAIAALVFAEMLESGYASVGEFHYVHHQPGGAPYDDIAETSMRILAAAQLSGIGLTHLPVLYSYGGAGQKALSGGQQRFGNDVEDFLKLVEAIDAACTAMPPDTRVGVAPHSLRATSPAGLDRLTAQISDRPMHIHIAEQPAEVRDVSDWLGARPVQWLLDNQDVNARWCLIHATHMTDAETRALAASGAVAGLCPITEANLGDGTFNGPQYLAAAGRFGIGSDSNVRISMTEELRLLEYSQRLRDGQRNVMTPGPGSVGQALYTGAARGGAQALARRSGQIAPGFLADLTAIDSTAPGLCALSEQQMFDGLCFAAGDEVVTDVWAAGRHMVRAGRHVNKATILRDYRRAMDSLRARL